MTIEPESTGDRTLLSRRTSLAAEVVRGAHEQARRAPITTADEHGRFPAVMLHDVFPLVIDANVLRDEILRTVRKGQRTILWTATNSGVFRLFCAEHVVEEVEEHLERWATKKKLDIEAARRAWVDFYRPLLRVVEVASDLTSLEESERLQALATRGGPHGDPDDVPTATLALLIGAPLLSKDNNALRAVYGDDFDRTAHKQWLGGPCRRWGPRPARRVHEAHGPCCCQAGLSRLHRYQGSV
jgi:predicted nucleic acid-binding protein